MVLKQAIEYMKRDKLNQHIFTMMAKEILSLNKRLNRSTDLTERDIVQEFKREAIKELNQDKLDEMVESVLKSQGVYDE